MVVRHQVVAVIKKILLWKKVYRTKIDLRVLGDKIKFNFFISGKVIGKGINEENLSKRPSFNFSYNTMYPVDVILKVKDGVQRVFLYFDEKNNRVLTT